MAYRETQLGKDFEKKYVLMKKWDFSQGKVPFLEYGSPSWTKLELCAAFRQMLAPVSNSKKGHFHDWMWPFECLVLGADGRRKEKMLKAL